MDADGTLHNLRPIGRLVVSGPDQEPRRPADSNFKGMWFTGPKEADAEAAEDSAAGAGDDSDAGGGDGLVIDLDLAGLLNGVAIEAEPSADDDGKRPEPGADAEPTSDDSASGTTTEATGRRSGAPDAATVKAEVAERMAALALVPGPDPVYDKDAEQPKKPPAALSASDLEAIRWRLDGGTLREVVDDKEALRVLGERLDGPLADEVDNVAKAGLLSVRAEVYRLLGELGMAAAASRLALAHAESARDVQSMVIAQAELAHILRLRGDFQEADRLFVRAASARVPETLRSVVHENAGRCCFDQGRHMEALDHFARAVRLGRPDDQELAERIGVCLEAVYIHVLRDGWGPYPRELAEINPTPSPKPAQKTQNDAFDETTAEQRIVKPR